MLARAGPEWLLLIHQIPPEPNYLRVKIGRRLQRLGAVAIKNSVYALPRSDQAQEDLEWVVREIVEGGGDASVCEARFVEGLSDREVEAMFNAAREADFLELANEIRRPSDKEELESAIGRFRKRLGDIEQIDFFAANGRDTVEGLLAALEKRLEAKSTQSAEVKQSRPLEKVQGRTWVTRKGIHVDRIASAWLIRRFIDKDARFKFVAAKGYRPDKGERRFDMFEAEFTHQEDRCTFEVLLESFGPDGACASPSVRRWSQDKRVKAFVAGVTAAAAGAIAGAAFVLARRSVVDLPTALIAALTFAALAKFKKAPEPLLILTAGAVGLLAKAF